MEFPLGLGMEFPPDKEYSSQVFFPLSLYPALDVLYEVWSREVGPG